MATYPIEEIELDHPVLLAGGFQACAVARCREFGSTPWQFQIDCHCLPRRGTCTETGELEWTTHTASDADKAERTFGDARLTEDAAIGACAAVLAMLTEGTMTEVTQRGSGVDYWIDKKRASLEISGIKNGSKVQSNSRHQSKIDQLK